MAKDFQETVRDVLVGAIENAGRSTSGAAKEAKSGGGPLGGMKGVAAGVGAAALAPMAVKGVGRLVREGGLEGVKETLKSPGKMAEEKVSDAGEQLTSKLGDSVSGKLDEMGGPAGLLKAALPFGGGGGATKGGALGIGRGRRMPVQQWIDVGIPLESVYNQWTQFEDWPTFMHRVTRVTQEDETTVSFAVKIWGKTKEFTAEIDTQRPDQRIKWRATQGMNHAGIVTFHELGPDLTRVMLGIDLQPGGLVEKMARGMRHLKRAVRGDFHRFKAFIEMQEHETGAWRGTIENGEVVEEHDPGYDEGREYSDPEDLEEFAQGSGEDDEEPDGAEQDEAEQDEADEDDESEPERRPRTRAGSQRRSSSNGRGADDEPQPRTRGRSSSGGGSSRGRSRSSSGSRRGSSSSGSGRRTRSRGSGD
jgi:uncharacterized membrane protein